MRGAYYISARPEHWMARQSRCETAMSQEPPEKMMFQLTLRRRGISDQAVLRAMEEVPREVFVEPADRADAYRDSALGIACGQTISQPFVVAYMTEQLQLQKHHRVLEIGTGSGYQAAILSRLCGACPDDRALPDAGRHAPAPARSARLRQCRGDAGRRLRRSGRRRRFRPHHRHRGDGANSGNAAGSGWSPAAS